MDAVQRSSREELFLKLPRGVSVRSPAMPRGEAIAMKAPLGDILPDGGFPRGTVVELASSANLGQGVSIALSACAEAQRESQRFGAEPAWCAFLDPDRTLYGPGVGHVASRSIDSSSFSRLVTCSRVSRCALLSP